MYIDHEYRVLDKLMADVTYLQQAKALLDDLLSHYDLEAEAFEFPTDKEWEKRVKQYRKRGVDGDLRHPCEKLHEKIFTYYSTNWGED